MKPSKIDGSSVKYEAIDHKYPETTKKIAGYIAAGVIFALIAGLVHFTQFFEGNQLFLVRAISIVVSGGFLTATLYQQVAISEKMKKAALLTGFFAVGFILALAAFSSGLHFDFPLYVTLALSGGAGIFLSVSGSIAYNHYQNKEKAPDKIEFDWNAALNHKNIVVNGLAKGKLPLDFLDQVQKNPDEWKAVFEKFIPKTPEQGNHFLQYCCDKNLPIPALVLVKKGFFVDDILTKAESDMEAWQDHLYEMRIPMTEIDKKLDHAIMNKLYSVTYCLLKMGAYHITLLITAENNPTLLKALLNTCKRKDDMKTDAAKFKAVLSNVCEFLGV